MPDPVLALDPVRLPVEPGGQVRTVLTIANAGSIVEGFHVDVVGGAAAWAQVLTPEVSVYPGRDVTVVVTFTAPAGRQTPSGGVPFGVRVTSVVDSTSSAVAEGDIEVGRVFGLQAKITPVNSAGRWSARHRIEVTNWGNTPSRLRLVASDPDEKLGFLIAPDVLDVPLGATSTARLKVRTRNPTLRGASAHLPFRVTCEPDPPLPPSGLPPGAPDPRRPMFDGAFNQRPIISRGAVAAAAVAVAAVAGVAAYAISLHDGHSTAAASSVSAPGAPDEPNFKSVSAAGPGMVLLQWAQPGAAVTSYKLVISSAAGRLSEQQLSGALTAKIVGDLAAGTRYCFELTPLRGAQPGPSVSKCGYPGAVVAAPPSTPVGAPSTSAPAPSDGTSASDDPSTSASASATTTEPSGPPGLPTFSPTDWIAEIAWLQPPDATYAPRALGDLATLQAIDPTSGNGYLFSQYYPAYANHGIQNPPTVVYAGPFATALLAATYCNEVAQITPTLHCLPSPWTVFQPGAPSPGVSPPASLTPEPASAPTTSATTP